MFEDIFKTVEPYLGFYIFNDERRLAITQYFAIDGEVFGTEVVVSEGFTTISKYFGAAKTQLTSVRVYVTQHAGGTNNYEKVLKAIEDMEKPIYINVDRVVTAGKQYNVRRAIVTLQYNCKC